MSLPIKLISTDFDGTIYAEFEQPPIADKFVHLIAQLQARGAKWVINTGRDMTSLMLALSQARLPIRPDYLVLVEREIHARDGMAYVGWEEWNNECVQAHEQLFLRVRQDLPHLTSWISNRFEASIYEDAYSPFCMIASKASDAEAIHEFLDGYCASVPNLCVVRNDVYARFSHAAFNKGTALARIARQLNVRPKEIFAAGDHLNDLPMLSSQHAGWLAANQNAIALVKETVLRQNGHVSEYAYGQGVAQALELCLQRASAALFINESSTLSNSYA